MPSFPNTDHNWMYGTRVEQGQFSSVFGGSSNPVKTATPAPPANSLISSPFSLPQSSCNWPQLSQLSIPTPGNKPGQKQETAAKPKPNDSSKLSDQAGKSHVSSTPTSQPSSEVTNKPANTDKSPFQAVPGELNWPHSELSKSNSPQTNRTAMTPANSNEKSDSISTNTPKIQTTCPKSREFRSLRTAYQFPESNTKTAASSSDKPLETSKSPESQAPTTTSQSQVPYIQTLDAEANSQTIKIEEAAAKLVATASQIVSTNVKTGAKKLPNVQLMETLVLSDNALKTQVDEVLAKQPWLGISTKNKKWEELPVARFNLIFKAFKNISVEKELNSYWLNDTSEFHSLSLELNLTKYLESLPSDNPSQPDIEKMKSIPEEVLRSFLYEMKPSPSSYLRVIISKDVSKTYKILNAFNSSWDMGIGRIKSEIDSLKERASVLKRIYDEEIDREAAGSTKACENRPERVSKKLTSKQDTLTAKMVLYDILKSAISGGDNKALIKWDVTGEYYFQLVTFSEQYYHILSSFDKELPGSFPTKLQQIQDQIDFAKRLKLPVFQSNSKENFKIIANTHKVVLFRLSFHPRLTFDNAIKIITSDLSPSPTHLVLSSNCKSPLNVYLMSEQKHEVYGIMYFYLDAVPCENWQDGSLWIHFDTISERFS